MAMPDADLVIVDEAHLSLADTRREIIEHYADACIVGLTATPARGDGRGLGEIYQDLVMGPSIRHLTDEGFLVPLRYFAPSEPDLSKLRSEEHTPELQSLMRISYAGVCLKKKKP